MSSASVRSIPCLSFIEPIFAWNVPYGISYFLEEMSSLSNPIVFLYFFHTNNTSQTQRVNKAYLIS